MLTRQLFITRYPEEKIHEVRDMIAEPELRFRRNLDMAQYSGQTALLRLRVAHVILEQQEL